jgi:hypothetical protein
MGGNSCVHSDHLAFQRLLATLPQDLMLRLIVFAGRGRALSRFLNDGYVAQAVVSGDQPLGRVLVQA